MIIIKPADFRRNKLWSISILLKVAIERFIYSFYYCFLITEGCEKSDYEKALNGEDIIVATQANDTASNITVSDKTEKTDSTEITDTNITDSSILKLNKKSLNIKALGAFHSSLNTWSAQLDINKNTYESSGYIFISYVEASLDGASTEINTSVLKANLKGTIDMKTLDFNGRVTGNILADRDDFFSGPIDLETTGKLSADQSQFTGTFTTPSLVIFDYMLEDK